MRTVVVSLSTDGGAARRLAETLANELSATGRDCTLLLVLGSKDITEDPPHVLPGVGLITVSITEDERTFVPDFPLLVLTRQISPILNKFDVVYVLTRDHPAMHAVRTSRYSLKARPFFVAIVNNLPDETLGPAVTAGAGCRNFGESYVLQHSDLIVCFDAISFEYALRVRHNNYGSSRIVRADSNQLQLLFDEVEMRSSEAAAAPVVPAVRCGAAVNSLLTIVVSCCCATDEAIAALLALDRQTRLDFLVVAIIDAAGSARGLGGFVEERRHRGWTLFRRESHVGEARAISLAVQQVSSKYLIFLDANDAPEPRLVERLLEAIEYSGGDLLEIWSRQVMDTTNVLEAEGIPASNRGEIINAPYGIDPVAVLRGTYDPRSVFLIRKSVLDSVGGYPEGLVAGREREALATRVALSGYRTDVLPEVLNSRRVPAAAEAEDILCTGDALRLAFDEKLNAVNIQSFAMVFQSINQELHESELEVEQQKRQLARRFPARGTRERLRLLMVVSTFPYPPMSGCMLRWWAMIRFLGERHDLTLVTFCTSEDSLRRHALSDYCRSIYAAEPGGARVPDNENLPFLVRARRNVNMRDALRSIPSDLYDAAIIEQIFLAPFRSEINCPTILGEHNIESRILAQVARTDSRSAPTPSFTNAKHESKLMRDYEDRVWPQFKLRTAVNPEEREEIQRRSHGGQTVLVENGTNTDLWLPEGRIEPNRVLFLGMLGYYPNIDGLLYFWREIWPFLVRRRPTLELIAAGSAVTSELRNLSKEPGFVLIENPSDIREAAMMASVSIVPLRVGSGTRLKILDSMALGLPIVSTSLGCAGLNVEDGVHLLVRDDPAGFAEGVDQLLGSVSLRGKLRRNGKAIVEEQYDWNKVLKPLESALWSVAR